MLVLSRKQKQQIMIGDNVVLTVLQVRGNTVRIGIDAPKEVHVIRGELEPAISESAAITGKPIPAYLNKNANKTASREPVGQVIEMKFDGGQLKGSGGNRLKDIISSIPALNPASLHPTS